MSFINFDFNLNHIFFIFILISYFIKYCIVNYIKEEGIDQKYEEKFFNKYIFILSNFFSIIPLCIIKIRSRKSQAEDVFLTKTQKSNLSIELLHSNDSPISFNKLLIRTFIVSLSDLFAEIFDIIFYIFIPKNNFEFNFAIIIKILMKYFLSKLILKIAYYRHHNFSVIINLICLILIIFVDIHYLYNNWDIKSIFFLILIIFDSIFYALEDVIGKKALIEEFLSPYSIILYKGVYETILLIIFSIPFFFIKIENKNIFNIFIRRLNTFKKILIIFLLTAVNFSYNVFIWMINDRFSPNDLAMIMVLQGLVTKIYLLIFEYQKFKEDLFESIYLISIYFILIISASIHSEIIIINSCGLSENTKKNINIKSEIDFESANGRALNSTSINSNDAQDINERNSNSRNSNSRNSLEFTLERISK